MIDSPFKLRSIRSFVRREGHLTPLQKQALEEFLPKYELLSQDAPFVCEQVFGKKAPVVVEIGFGRGASLIALARHYPDVCFVGVEVYRTGIAMLVQAAEKWGLKNLRVINQDAVQLLTYHFLPGSLQGILIYFPDPWPKTRHRKRRLINKDFITLVEPLLVPEGFLHVKTDWEPYAKDIQRAFEHFSGLTPLSETPVELRQGLEILETKYEKRGQRLGHKIWEKQYRKNKKRATGEARRSG